MNYRAALVDGIFVVRCLGPIATTDLATLELEFTRARQTHGGPLNVLAFSSSVTNVPAQEVRIGLGLLWRRVATDIDSLHIVVASDLFSRTIIRSVATGIMLISAVRTNLRMHHSVEEALESLRDHRRRSVRAWMRTAHASGVLPDPDNSAQVAIAL